MKFTATTIQGLTIIDIERIEDERGFFARSWDETEARSRGMVLDFPQCNISFNAKKGTLRGMHYQIKPYEEPKVVRCTQGAIFDVVLDLRPDSATLEQWFATELSAENRRMLYIPAGCAHGFQTLVDDTEVFYQMGESFHPEAARGVRFDDPSFKIEWPQIATRIVSEKDISYPDWV